VTRATAFQLYQQAIAASLEAEIIGVPAHKATNDAGATVDVPEDHMLRIRNPNGELGPGILKTISDAGLSLASSDALLR
jgi:hypothetical protein